MRSGWRSSSQLGILGRVAPFHLTFSYWRLFFSYLLKAKSDNKNVRGVMAAPSAHLFNHILFDDDSLNLVMFKENLEGDTIIRDTDKEYCNAFGYRR